MNNSSQGDASHINDGIAELAIARGLQFKKKNRKKIKNNIWGLDVGVVSTTRLTDATPAANFAKVCPFYPFWARKKWWCCLPSSILFLFQGVHRLMEHDSSTEIKVRGKGEESKSNDHISEHEVYWYRAADSETPRR